MTSPTFQTDHSPLGEGGPSSTFLRQLLDEINGATLPTIIRNLDARKTASNPQFSPRNSQFTPGGATTGSPSVWVGGASIAQDAREKLRAADATRFQLTPSQLPDFSTNHKPRLRLVTSGLRLPSLLRRKRRISIDQSESGISKPVVGNFPAQIRRNNISPRFDPSTLQSLLISLYLPSTSLSTTPLLAGSDVSRAESPPIFCDIEADISTTPSPTDLVTSAVTADSTEPSTMSGGLDSPKTFSDDTPDQRMWSGDARRGMSTENTRTITLPAQQTQTAVQPGSMVFPRLNTIDDYHIMRDRLMTATERLSTSPEQMSDREATTVPHPSRDTTTPQQPARPSTPIHNVAHRSLDPDPTDSPLPPLTPNFARPLLLIDADISIYKHDHGEAWRDFPLCLYCFRQRGSFNRILTHGYEVCGGDYVLRGHHWEAATNPHT